MYEFYRENRSLHALLPSPPHGILLDEPFNVFTNKPPRVTVSYNIKFFIINAVLFRVERATSTAVEHRTLNINDLYNRSGREF